jgi:hypothetical protein
VASFWDISVQNAKCINLTVFNYFTISFNIFSDLVVLLYPIPIILKLEIRPRKKFNILFIVATGIIPVLASAVRVWAVVNWSSSLDVLYNWVWCSLFSTVEMCTAIITASLPSLAAMVGKTIKGSTSFSGSGSKSNSRLHTHSRIVSESYARLETGIGGRSAATSRNDNYKEMDVQLTTLETQTPIGSSGHNTSEESILPVQSNVSPSRYQNGELTDVYPERDGMGPMAF